MHVAEELLGIDLRLRFALFGLECALGVSFSGFETERVFSDAQDQVSEKQYVFFKSANLLVSGRVDSYESDSIWIRVEGNRAAAQVLQRVVEGSQFPAFLLRQSLEAEEP